MNRGVTGKNAYDDYFYNYTSTVIIIIVSNPGKASNILQTYPLVIRSTRAHTHK